MCKGISIVDAKHRPRFNGNEIICEKLYKGQVSEIPYDYKVFMSEKGVIFIFVVKRHYNGEILVKEGEAFFDSNFKIIPHSSILSEAGMKYYCAPFVPDDSIDLDQMLSFAKKIFSYMHSTYNSRLVRVDFLNTNEGLLLNEVQLFGNMPLQTLSQNCTNILLKSLM